MEKCYVVGNPMLDSRGNDLSVGPATFAAVAASVALTMG